MKRPIGRSAILGFVLVALGGCSLFTERGRSPGKTESATAPSPGGAERTAVTAQLVPAATNAELRSALTPYGRWVEVPVYGKVWKPAAELVGADWMPFTVGRWVFSPYGWLWVSAFEKWGWAAFHFGRFASTPTEGWVWVPDTQWTPASVAWRESENYIGWGPLPPGYSVIEDVQAGSPVHIPQHVWVFLNKRHFQAPNVRPYVLVKRHREALLRVTRLVRGWIHLAGHAAYTGPRPGSVEEVFNTPVKRSSLRELARLYGSKCLPPQYPRTAVPLRRRYSEVRPDVDRIVSVVGPNSPKRLPPRRVARFYIPPPSEKEKSTPKPTTSSTLKRIPRTPTPRSSSTRR